jgi:hypothetical protein
MLFLGSAFLTAISGAGTAETSNIDMLARCRSIVDQAAQLRCYQDYIAWAPGRGIPHRRRWNLAFGADAESAWWP